MKAKKIVRYLKIKYLTEIQSKGYALYIGLAIFFVFLMPQIIWADTFGNAPELLVIEQVATSNINITIEPEFPIAGEITQITASGTWHNSCVPKFHSAKVSNDYGGQDVIIQGQQSEEEICDNTITEWSLTKPLVIEEAASTILQFIILSSSVDNESQSSSTARYASTHFFVHDGITFQQSAPGIDERIQITISGWTVSCTPIYQSHMIEGKTIAINIGVPEWAEVCGQSVEKWVEVVDIGTLSAGSYQVEAYVRMMTDTSPKLLHATMLTVGDPKYQIFMPIIESNMKPSTGLPCSVDQIAVSLCY